ncbi:alpha/beta fold hydrolase [Amycolatopsis jejuensis]|uniref:alpha/beta fold hydrolase n=1 Tax=Amycolatopsis jejuensis TaxID=330084 RepID=UPI0005251D81|nr:alpha/beta hydrolase [Amycolatopsis jejuensis]
MTASCPVLVFAPGPRALADEFAVHTVEPWLSDPEAVLDEAGVKRCIVLGESWCATLAMRFAVDARDRVVAAVFIRPPGPRWEPVAALFEETMRVARASGMRAVVDAARPGAGLEENPAAGPFGHRVATDPAFRDELLATPVERYVARIVRCAQSLLVTDLPPVEMPVLVAQDESLIRSFIRKHATEG